MPDNPPARRRRLLHLGDLFPPGFRPDQLELQIASHATRSLAKRRRQAERLRAEHPDESPEQLIDRLFAPLLNRSMAYGTGSAVLEMLPLSLLYTGAARRHQSRQLLDLQIDLIADGLLLLEPTIDRESLGETVVSMLDEVYDLERIKVDLEHVGLRQRLRRAARKEAVQFVLRKLLGPLGAATELDELFRKYDRWHDLRAALLRRARAEPEGG